MEYAELVASLEKNPFIGTGIGHNFYKIRISIASKGKGKSGGARIITCIFLKEKEIYLVSIYDKSEKDSISNTELKKLIDSIGEI